MCGRYEPRKKGKKKKVSLFFNHHIYMHTDSNTLHIHALIMFNTLEAYFHKVYIEMKSLTVTLTKAHHLFINTFL